MDEPQTRGYLLERVFSFVDHRYDGETAQKILGSLPEETLALRPQLHGADWYSRDHMVALIRAIGTQAGDEERAYRELRECGRFMSNEATNSYLKLLLKIMTPSLFAKKIASFWERDNRNSGNFDPSETEVSDNRLRLKMTGAGGFDFSAPVSAGFCSFILDAMGKKDIEVKLDGWSLETPAPESYVLEITWT